MFTPMLALLLGVAQAADQAVLFIGNSYTQFNAPHSIDGNYAQLVAEGLPAWEIESQSYTRVGHTLPSHLEDAVGDTGLHDFLTDGGSFSWDIVVLQDQSQVPGFPQTHPQWVQSRDAAVELSGMITEAGAAPKLFMTWGYRDGDAINVARFPDYPTMQGLVAEGYGAYALAIATGGYMVDVVPVGMAWQHIYDAHTAVGEDPLDSGALFSRLYAGDGSHPSVLGSYLASLVFYTALTGQSPAGLEWAPDAITEHDRDAVQAAAAVVMADAIGDPEDTGQAPGPGDSGSSGEVGGDGEDTGDTGDTGPLHDKEISIEHAEPKEGCGCATGSGGGPAFFGLLLVGLRRRSR
jgi:MYXO-CTERM domain-containing protein